MTAYFLSVFLGTFMLEDVALASALALVASGRLGLVPAFFACFLGIGIGDLALYLLGFVAGKLGIEKRFPWLKNLKAQRFDFVTHAIVLSRFVPGTRLPTYLAAGLFRYPFWRFFLVTLVSVFGWVALAFGLGQSLKPVLANHWLFSVGAVLLLLKLAKNLVPKMSNAWERKALLHSWRQWKNFEFWPATFFYLPIVPLYFFLSLKHGSFLAPFYANPEVENGGLLGESKWDFLRHLSPRSPHTLPALKLGTRIEVSRARELLSAAGFAYPFILKPDVGQRGFGVRIIRDEAELAGYLQLADFDIIAQELSTLPREAGIFYVRHPSHSEGRIFSVTDKVFPTITGNGLTKLGDLILADSRARIIASTYFSRFQDRLDSVPAEGEVIALAACGNHCQGAIFLNGQKLNTPALQKTIERLARSIPHFYFGRFDVRYNDHASLMAGTHFEIVEINGAGSEATHIWDAKTPLREAYATLFAQWRLLFAIGDCIRKSQKTFGRVHPRRFLRESFRVFVRKERLSVSS